MNKTKHVRLSKILALSIACSFLVLAYFLPPTQTPQVQGPSVEQRSAEWLAQPMYEVSAGGSETSSPSGYSPSQLKTAYHLPSSGGSGATIAIIVAYDTANIEDYLSTFSAQYGLPLPDSSNFEIKKMASTYDPDPYGIWSLETALDVEWAHAIAPQAKILLVEAVDAYSNHLLDAVDYATSRSDVSAISMSWGGPEDSWMTPLDSYFDKPVAFFAASGDSGAGVNWPAVSPYVVAVGGTTLSLAGDGTVLSETAWSKSGGGISAYENQPSYQTAYGLAGSKRSVPDVSYNADPATGVPVYNGTWYLVGGTSAGAPQWAAIYALDKSASHTNLYDKAKTDYASYFRDITSGSNGGYTATVGYDYVTGLGSPLTFEFDASLEVTPAQGPPSGEVTLTGTSFTAGSSVNIEYLNPQTSTWTLVATDMPTASSTFTYATTAPDLLQNNPAGDNPPVNDSIIYRVIDSKNGYTVTSTNPYNECRRGLASVGSAAASGIFGNNTDLSSIVAVNNGEAIAISGLWFKPGTATFAWDNTPLVDTAAIGADGSFSATVNIPSADVGKHTITVNDGAYDFCFDLAFVNESLPLTTLPEGPQIAVFATAFTALILVVWVKRK